MELGHVTGIEMKATHPIDAAGRERVIRSLVTRARSAPGIVAASVSLGNPVADSRWRVTLAVEGVGQFLNGDAPEPGKPRPPGCQVVGPFFAEAVGGRLLSGRDIEWDDGIAGRRVALVNRQAAMAYWGRIDVLGRRLKLRPTDDFGEDWAEVVGVVDNMQHEGFRGAMRPEIYLSVLREAQQRASLFVLLRGAPVSTEYAYEIADTARDTFRPTRVFTLRQEADKSVATLWQATAFLTSTAVLAMVSQLAAVWLGIYVYLRVHSREVGIRIAFGEPTSVSCWWLARRSVRAAILPTGLGLIGGSLLCSAIVAFDPDVSPPGPTAFLVASSVSLLSAAVSCWLFATTWFQRAPAALLREPL